MESEIYGEKVWNKIQENFPQWKGSVYLDHAGSALYSQAQLADVFGMLTGGCFGNPHSRNPSSRLCSELIEKTRLEVLEFFNADPNIYSIVFTSGATDSLKLIGENFDFSGDPCQSDAGRHNGAFVYLRESHTSVVGMREYTLNSSISTYSIPADVIEAELTDRNGEGDVTKAATGNPNSLFVYPAQCNFSGYKYPLDWIDKTQRGLLKLSDMTGDFCINGTDTAKCSDTSDWYCLLDAASYVSTSKLDLSIHQPDFVALSFYKIVGYPTGLGALIVHRRAGHTLKKRYFGGGTVEMFSSARNVRVDRRLLHERFENGTLDFLSILSLRQGLCALTSVATMDTISLHTFHLSQYLHRCLSALKYHNGRGLIEFYTAAGFNDRRRQGPIVTFNVKNFDGHYIGYAQVEKILSLYDIHVRTGCFCNPAACQRYLKLTEDDIQSHYMSGHKCGDENDMVDGGPTGAIRVSFGYMSRKSDAERLVAILTRSFLSSKPSSAEATAAPVESNEDAGTLIGIHLYPIKSCASFNPQRWPVSRSGLLYDRQWVIVNAAGAVLTQKRESKLCLIIPEIDLVGNVLILRHRNKTTSSISLALDDARADDACHTKICGKVVGVRHCTNAVDRWLSDVLDQPGLRLLRNGNESSFANDSAFLVINRNSALSLERQSMSSGFQCQSTEEFVRRFRANLVVDGVAAFEEENWTSVTIDKFTFKNMGPCYRCQMICIDQSTASRDQRPLSSLAKQRGNKLPFGIHLELVDDHQTSLIEIGCKLKDFQTK